MPKKKVIVAPNLKDSQISKMKLKQATPHRMAMGRLPESAMEVRGQRTVLQRAHL